MINRSGHSSFKMEYELFNFTDQTISVRTKSGIGYEIRPMTGFSTGLSRNVAMLHVSLCNVDIYQLSFNDSNCYTALDKEIVKALSLLVRKHKEDDHHTEHYNDEIHEIKYNRDVERIHNLEIEVPITAGLVSGKDNGIHSELLGITVYKNVSDPTKVHAYNTPMHYARKNASDLKDNEVKINVRLVDPNNVVGELWINVLGQALMLPGSSATTEGPGLYISITESVDILNSEFISIEEFISRDSNIVKKLSDNGIFRTRREAIEGGNAAAINHLEKRLADAGKKINALKEEFDSTYDKTTQLEQKISQVQAASAHAKQMSDIKETLLTADLKHLKQITEYKEYGQKNEINMLRSKSSNDVVGMWIRNITGAIGLGATVYKLLC